MGFLKQDAPVIDYQEWSKGSRAEKIVPMARHWAEVGFGTPVVLHLFYVVKILLYILAAWLIVRPRTLLAVENRLAGSLVTSGSGVERN